MGGPLPKNRAPHRNNNRKTAIITLGGSNPLPKRYRIRRLNVSESTLSLSLTRLIDHWHHVLPQDLDPLLRNSVHSAYWMELHQPMDGASYTSLPGLVPLGPQSPIQVVITRSHPSQRLERVLVLTRSIRFIRHLTSGRTSAKCGWLLQACVSSTPEPS